MGILTDLLCYLIVVLICISPMATDVEHLFRTWWPLYIFFEKCLLRFFANFLIRLFDFCYWAVWILSIFWILIPQITACSFFPLLIFPPQKEVCYLKSSFLLLLFVHVRAHTCNFTLTAVFSVPASDRWNFSLDTQTIWSSVKLFSRFYIPSNNCRTSQENHLAKFAQTFATWIFSFSLLLWYIM